MALTLSCPKCALAFEPPVGHLGDNVECPRCFEIFSTSDAVPAAVATIAKARSGDTGHGMDPAFWTAMSNAPPTPSASYRRRGPALRMSDGQRAFAVFLASAGGFAAGYFTGTPASDGGGEGTDPPPVVTPISPTPLTPAPPTPTPVKPSPALPSTPVAPGKIPGDPIKFTLGFDRAKLLPPAVNSWMAKPAAPGQAGVWPSQVDCREVIYPCDPFPAAVALRHVAGEVQVIESFDLRTGARLGLFNGDAGLSGNIALSPDGRFIAWMDARLAPRHAMVAMIEHDRLVFDKAPGDGGKTLEFAEAGQLVTFDDKVPFDPESVPRFPPKAVSKYDIMTGQRLWHLILSDAEAQATPFRDRLVVSPDRRRLVMPIREANETSLLVIDLEQGASLGRVALVNDAVSLSELAFSRDGKRLAAFMTSEGRLSVAEVDMASLKLVETLPLPPTPVLAKAIDGFPSSWPLNDFFAQYLPHGGGWLALGAIAINRADSLNPGPALPLAPRERLQFRRILHDGRLLLAQRGKVDLAPPLLLADWTQGPAPRQALANQARELGLDK